MRIALVSPYSWTYPGGVTRHIEALAEQYLAGGHDVRVLAPYDPTTAARCVGIVAPARRRASCPTTSSRSGDPRRAVQRRGVQRGADAHRGRDARRELRGGDYDVVHLHEPVAPTVCWDALMSVDAPLVGTFHPTRRTRSPTVPRRWSARAGA